MNCNNIPLTTKVGDAVGSKNITQLWQDHFSTLLNSAHNIIFYARTFLLCKNDMRKTWGVINDTLQSNRRSKGQSELIFGNRIICDSDEIANHFNDYFINISCTLSQQIQPVHSFDDYLNGNVTSKFQFHSVSQDYIGKLIDTLKNKASYGHDNISNILIKRAKEVLIESLTLLVNQMLKSGHFPSELKISRLKPLFKKGDPSEFSNYRPISLLP